MSEAPIACKEMSRRLFEVLVWKVERDLRRTPDPMVWRFYEALTVSKLIERAFDDGIPSSKELLKLPNFGPKCLRELSDIMDRYHLGHIYGGWQRSPYAWFAAA